MNSDAATADEIEIPRPGRPAWLTRAILVVVAVAVTITVVRLIGRIDWAAVWHTLTNLSWWHPFVLIALVVVRQTLLAMPLKFFVPGVTVYKAAVNDLGANLMSTFVPPPSDIALRVAMFSSWGVSAAKGLAGTVMNTVTFYIARFSTPVLGFVLLAVVGEEPSYRWFELLSILLSISILVTLLLVLRSDVLARSVGTRGALALRRFLPKADPERWAQACMDFRADVADRFRYGFPRALLSQWAMQVADFFILLLCLRFVGVPATDVSLIWVAIAYLFAFPFTALPFWGLGVVDAFLLAALVEAGGWEVEAAGIAGLVVWRVFTVAFPVVLGLGAVANWRRTAGRIRLDAE